MAGIELVLGHRQALQQDRLDSVGRYLDGNVEARRSRRLGADRTWSAPPSLPPGGLPIPMRARVNSSERNHALIERRPLWPARPAAGLDPDVPSGRSSSSWTITSLVEVGDVEAPDEASY